MSTHAILRMERAIISALQPLTGPRSSGQVLVKSLGPSGTLLANTYGIPAITSNAGNTQIDRACMVKVAANTPITSAGAAVPIVSVQGGKNQNLAAGTSILWDPQDPAVERTSVISTALTGGDEADEITEPGAVKRIVTFEGLGKVGTAKGLWTASVGAFPAAVIAWEGSDDGYKRGRGRQSEDHRFRVYVVSSRLDSDAERCDQGKACMQAIKEILVDRAAADGESFSNPPISLVSSGRLATGESAYVYWTECVIHYSNFKREFRSFVPWTKTRLQETTIAPSPPNTPDPLVDVDVSWNQ